MKTKTGDSAVKARKNGAARDGARKNGARKNGTRKNGARKNGSSRPPTNGSASNDTAMSDAAMSDALRPEVEAVSSPELASREQATPETETPQARPRPPVVMPSRSTTPDGYRRCPTNDTQVLVQQTIHTSHCSQRQRTGYHKCFSCDHCNTAGFDGEGLPPLDNSPSHLSNARLAGLNPILY